ALSSRAQKPQSKYLTNSPAQFGARSQTPSNRLQSLGGLMKKTLSLFALLAICVAVVILTTVHGQNTHSNAGKFRRTSLDKRIPNQYIVVLKNDVDDV